MFDVPSSCGCSSQLPIGIAIGIGIGIARCRCVGVAVGVVIFIDNDDDDYFHDVVDGSVPARLGRRQGAKEIGHNLARANDQNLGTI